MFEKLLEAILGLTNALTAHTAALAANPTPKAAKTKASPDAGAQAQATATVATPAATSTPVANAATTTAQAAAAVTSQEAGAAMVRVANEVNRDKAVEILGQFGAQTFAGVKPESYAAFKAACDAALAKPAAAAGLM